MFGIRKAEERRTYVGSVEMEAARSFRKDPLVSIGGYSSCLEAGEGWDLENRVLGGNLSVSRTTSFVVHDEGSPTLVRLIRKNYAYGQSIGPDRSKNMRQARGQLNAIQRIFDLSLKISRKNPIRSGAGVFLLKSLKFEGGGLELLVVMRLIDQEVSSSRNK